MRRLVLLAWLLYGLFLAGLLTLRGGILVLSLPILIFLGASFFFGPEQLKLKITRSLSSERVAQGVPVEVTLVVTNEGSHLEQVLVEDLVPRALDLLEGEPQVVTPLAPGESVELNYTLRGVRGYYHIPGVRVTAYDLLGLFRRQAVIPTSTHLSVLPPILKLGRVAIRPQRTRPYSGLIPANRGGPGVEFFGVREAQPGDPLRWVNWRATARREEAFFSNEFEQECIVDVSMILDIRRRTYVRSRDETFFEHAVLATAALAESLLNDGNRVGLLLFGGLLRNWTLPGYGRIQRERILRTLTEASLGEFVERLDYLPTKLFPVRSQIVLVSPLIREDLKMLTALRAYGYPILVVSPNPVAFEATLLRRQSEVALAARIAGLERELLLRKLRRAGIQVVDWPVHEPLHQVVRRQLRRTPLWARGLQLRVAT